ncbi:MAG: hypothetical protein JWO38_3221 [Gemmataceae bacterium]|nr:hypothetical protein [Gemmataceae bacterium]
MRYWNAAIVGLSVAAALWPGRVSAQAQAAPSGAELGAQVRGVFAAKCAACHGPDLPKPKGRFGYVLDLRRVAGNPEMVIPSRPDESELWTLIRRDEMPPADSPHGPLTRAEKDLVRAWIAAGAPDAGPAAPGDSQPSAQLEASPDAPAGAAVLPRGLRWLGKFHLLVLHFPIALVVVAGIAELLSARKPGRVPSESVRFCLWLAAIGAVPTAALGWLYAAAGNGAGSPQLLTIHRWLGTTTALWIVATAVCAERDVRRGARSRRTRLMLAAGVLLTGATAHLGGLLDRGIDFFDW